MKVEISRTALKFLAKIPKSDEESIKNKIKELISYLDKGLVPVKEMGIKKLKGNWKPLKRVLFGDYRVIFDYNLVEKRLIIVTIDKRDKVY
jgi:mRNA-degrading endonuclease RelE of RelBE toxin-antitoxin system